MKNPDLTITPEQATALVEGCPDDGYECVDEVQGDFGDGVICGNQLIFRHSGKLYRFYFIDNGIGGGVDFNEEEPIDCELVTQILYHSCKSTVTNLSMTGNGELNCRLKWFVCPVKQNDNLYRHRR